MFEIIFGFCTGYFAGRAVTVLGQPKLDRLLVWDQDIFAWRGVPFGAKLHKQKKYLAATEVLPNEAETKNLETNPYV